jgi:nicotinamidase/pyrazinamidase
MNFPDFYDASRVGDLFRPDINRAIATGSAVGAAPAAADTTRWLLLLVDMQVDFIHPEGALTVPGAVADTRRTIEWIFEHLTDITTIATSLDSHIPGQIFYPTWWVDAQGQHPPAYTVITEDDVQSGRWQPAYDPEWSREYVRKLEAQARKQLMIWPYHTMIGSEGHNLMPALYETLAYHSAARHTRPQFITKGLIPNTEYYSLLEPEVKVPGTPGGELNTDFLAQLQAYDAVYITGQAKSHCVLETARTLMRYFADQPAMIDRLHVLLDCTSSVAHPEIDFESLANEAYAQFAADGLHLVTTKESSGS